MRGRIIRRSRVRLGLLVVVGAAVLLTVLVGSSAALPSGGCVFTVATGETTCTFSHTGAAEQWEVPFGVTSVTFDAFGAQGAGGTDGGGGGLGGRATATIAVTPGDAVEVLVGGQNGFNGGGPGGSALESGGSGGGASDVRTGSCAATTSCGLSDRVIVAGGGGGGGGHPSGGAGGTGGADGATGSPSTGVNPSGPGTGGTGIGPGTGGSAGGGGSAGSNGSLGIGGAGASASQNGGGGGGGGRYGGGGGGSAIGGNGGGGGGGGSSLGPGGATFQNGLHSGNGVVTVTYTGPIDQLSALLAEVDGLTPKSTRAKLAKTLNRLIGHVFEDETNHACKDLEVFIRQVHAAKKLSHDQRASLTAQALIIADTLGC